jgi:hypothetical protein
MLGNRTTSSGTSLWSADDSLHLFVDAYRDLADAVLELAACTRADDSTSCGSVGGDPESVGTMQPCWRRKYLSMAGQRDRRPAQWQGQNVNVLGWGRSARGGFSRQCLSCASHHLGGGSSWGSTIGGWRPFGG